jgi:hypothetical protein
MGRDTLTREIREKQLKKIGYSFKWDHSNFIVDNTLRIAPTKDRWCWLGTEQHWHDFGDETLEEILELCDEGPNGCSVRMGTDVEEYGHRE